MFRLGHPDDHPLRIRPELLVADPVTSLALYADAIQGIGMLELDVHGRQRTRHGGGCQNDGPDQGRVPPGRHRPAGRRRRYYHDNGEDALIMWFGAPDG